MHSGNITLLIDVVAHSVTGVTNELTEKIEKLPIKKQKKIIKVIHTLLGKANRM